MKFLDCTLRDGGYYNSWDFPESLIKSYLHAMQATGVDVVELGLRSLKNNGFKGACAYTTDEFLKTLSSSDALTIGVMVNASELLEEVPLTEALAALFPLSASEAAVSLVRIACHKHEFLRALPAATWLKSKGYQVGFNLMQISGSSEAEVRSLAREAASYPVDVLYFADSMGSMSPEQTANIIGWLRNEWPGDLGIHTHDNLGMALANSLRAMDEGVVWVDATVTGMGRGPGNARTEELAIEIASRRGVAINLVPLMTLLREHFRPMQNLYGWGTNPYYYLAGKYGIHPTYIQEMLGDSRYSEEDILAVISHLRAEGGTKFSPDTLDAARNFYRGSPAGKWSPESLFAGREVLLLGSGQGVARHRAAIEQYIARRRPLVLALNTQGAIDATLIDLRIACHPVRLLADCETHAALPQPLITSYEVLPDDVKLALGEKEIFDFGLSVQADTFHFGPTHCVAPSSLVLAYALAVVTSGRASRMLMAGFDGYAADDPRSREVQRLFDQYMREPQAVPLQAITPTRYNLKMLSVYAL